VSRMYKINLLPDELQKGSSVDMGRIKRIAVATVAAVVVVGGFGVYLATDYARLTQQAPVPAPVTAQSETPEKTGVDKEHHFLPETTRVIDGEEALPEPGSQPEGVVNPFAGPVVLTGVVYSGGDGDLAIIEAGKAAYIVGLGDTVAGLWKVAQIDRDAVVLEGSDERKIRLELSGR